MLQQNAVATHTLDLIRQLHKDPVLSDFSLAGGTALALWLGHRESVDIDLFSTTDFAISPLLQHLEKTYGFEMHYSDKNTLKGVISGIFVDLLTHDYPMVKDTVTEDEIRLCAPEDLAAMKVNVIGGDGTRIKDFIDIYFLLDIFSLQEILSFYTKKYGLRSELHAVKSLGYFDDLPRHPAWPVMLKEQDLTLERIQKKITHAIRNYLAL